MSIEKLGTGVLMVTSSTDRACNMVEAVRGITEGRGSNFFLFAEREAIAVANPFRIDWMTGKGEHVKLND